MINASPLMITGNLVSAMIQLQHQSELRVLWIDALCINQDDEEEKAYQVQIIRHIYSKADTVVL
jgi:hypothetical protein